MEFGFEMAVFGAEDEDRRAVQCAQGFAEASCGQEMLGEVARVEHDDVEVADKATMLESIVK